MSDRVLSKMGIYVDEMTSKLRLIDPDAKRFTTALLDNSEDFTEMGKIFVSDLSDILNASSKLASLVEEAKIEAIGYRASIQKEIDDGEDEEKEVQLLLQRKKAEVNQKQMYLDSLLQQKREKIDKIHHSY